MDRAIATLLTISLTPACGGRAAIERDAAGDGVVGCSDAAGWATVPPVLGGALQETAVVELDGKIYVLGGFDGALRVIDSVRVFDPASCAWSDGPPLPRTMHHANAAVANGAIYVLGGLDTISFTAFGDSYVWRPGDAGWSTRAAMPPGSERGSAAIGAIGDVIYLAGGLAGRSLDSVVAYSTTTDTWDTGLPTLPMARDHGCGAAVGGKLYAVGGRAGATTALSGSVLEYAPGGIGWVERAPMPTARGGIACGVIDDRIIAAGGEGNPAATSGVFGEVEAYSVSADRWEVLPTMVTPRHGMGAAAAAGVLYVPGGATKQGFGAVEIHERLRL